MVWRMTWETLRLLLELQVIVVILIDVSGAVESLKEALGRWLKVKVERLKPIDCSFCMYHHIALAVLLCAGGLTVESYMAICILAAFTRVTKAVVETVAGGLAWLIEQIKI